MAVANTYTLEHSYGSRVVVKGAGFLLNNEMIDFNWRPGVTDRTGAHRHRAEPDRARQAHAQLADADDRRQGRQGAAGHRQPRRPDDHQHGAEHRGQRGRLRHGRPGGGGRAAAASPVVPRRAALRGDRASTPTTVEKLRAMGHTRRRHAARATPIRSGSTRRRARTTARRTGASAARRRGIERSPAAGRYVRFTIVFSNLMGYSEDRGEWIHCIISFHCTTPPWK